jgi:nucleotide-binding universal stress UspA family protein
MKTILVPLGGSTLAEQVLPYVRLLAELLRSSVRLLHILTEVDCAAIMTSGHVPRRTADGMLASYRERQRHALELLHDQAEIYLATHVAARIQAESDVRVGVPHQRIAECADAVPESLIALATHGYGGLRRWAVGSVADKAIQAARAGLPRTQPSRRDCQRAGIEAYPGTARWIGSGSNRAAIRR